MRSLFFVLMILAGSRAALAAQESAQAPAAALGGTVVTPDNRPARGVTVALVSGAYDEPPKVVARRTTDDQGRFAFAEVKRPGQSAPALRPPVLIARDAQGRIGWSQRFRGGYLPEANIKLKLREVDVCRGQITDAACKPIAGARIVPLSWTVSPLHARERDHIEVPREFAAEDETKTDAGGAFVLKGVPRGGGAMIRVSAAGFGAPVIALDAGREVTIPLARAGSIAGVLTGAKNVTEAAGAKLAIRRQSPDNPGDGAAFRLHYWSEFATKADGTFRFEELPPGGYVITASLDDTLPYYAEPTAALEVKPGQAITGLSIRLHPAVAVSGRVIDKESGAGAKDVWVMFSHVGEQGRLRYTTRTKTGVDGRYIAYVKPGTITAHVQQGLQGYLSAPGPEGYPKVDAATKVEYPDIRLLRTATLSGEVVDESGAPAPAAQVYRVVGPTSNSRHGPFEIATVDGAGKFVFSDVDPMEDAPLRARTKDAATSAVTLVSPENLAKPARLVLSPKNASRLRGTVADQNGRPVPGASVAVQWDFTYQSRRWPGSGSSGTLEKHRTDVNGRFETNALWPAETYRVQVSAEGFGKGESPRLVAKAGRLHDLPPVVLQRTGGVVRGRVIDSAGEPIRDVRVFNSGDAPQPVQTHSDAAGRFRLEDLFVGAVYVCAHKSGYRFTAHRVNTDGGPVAIQLFRSDEPIPPRSAPIKPPSFDEQRRVARQLLEKLWALPMDVKRTAMRTLLESMARLDPEVALRWGREAGGRSENIVRAAVAEHLAETDPDEALALLAQADADGAYYAIKALTERYLHTDPAKALRFAEEAAVRARTLEQPARIWSLAEIGSLVRQLGKEAAGRNLIDEAAALAEKAGTQQHQALARGLVAQALAPYDLERARRLLQPLTDGNDVLRYTMMVASASMRDDPALPPRVRMQIAYRLAAGDPPAAVRIVESISGDAKIKAEAFGWLAVAIAPKDRKLAWSLIDRSLAIYEDDAGQFRTWSNYGAPSVFAARVAGQAQEVGYPDMDSVVARVLAVRQTGREETPARVAESHTAAAMILALTDPATAADILRSIEPRANLIGTGHSSIRREYWFKAWALADLDRAVELVNCELAGSSDKTKLDLQDTGIAGMIEILTIPPAERPRHMLRYFGVFWFPGEE